MLEYTLRPEATKTKDSMGLVTEPGVSLNVMGFWPDPSCSQLTISGEIRTPLGICCLSQNSLLTDNSISSHAGGSSTSLFSISLCHQISMTSTSQISIKSHLLSLSAVT